MNWKKILAAGALTAAAAALLVGCGTDNSSQAEQKLPDKIVIGLDDNFPPMGFRDESGNRRFRYRPGSGSVETTRNPG